MRAVHAESLLHLTPVRHFFRDAAVLRATRRIDHRWLRSGHLPRDIAGFNPFRSTVYAAYNSPLVGWWKHPHRSFRSINVADRLILPAFFHVHDYLHVWAFHLICGLYPALGFGSKRLRADNIEAMAFCHLVTEAVATVGLDYWYLSTLHLNARCPIGTLFRMATVSYHLDQIDEIRRFNRSFDSERVEHFGDIVRLYLGQGLAGFSVLDLKRSPVLYKWLQHELVYGEKQRSYIRQWLAFLGGLPPPTARQSTRPISVAHVWQRRLIEEVGRELWQKIKLDRFVQVPAPAKRPWESAPDRFDPRFVNLGRHMGTVAPAAALHASIGKERDPLLYAQIVSRFPFDRAERRIDGLVRLRDSTDATAAQLQAALEGLRPLAVDPAEPRDLFLLP